MLETVADIVFWGLIGLSAFGVLHLVIGVVAWWVIRPHEVKEPRT